MSNDKIILEGCIKSFQESNDIDLPQSEIFELFALTQIHKNRNITYENIQHSIVDGSNDGGIDSIMVFIDDEYIENIDDLENFTFSTRTKSHFVISQCKKENSFKEGPIDKLITTVPILFDLEKNETALLSRFNSGVVNQAILLRNIWQKTAINGGRISVNYVYTTNAPERETNNVFDLKLTQLEETSRKVFSTDEISVSLFSSKELLSLYQSHKPNRLVIEFKDKPLFADYEEIGVGYIGTVKLVKYKEFLTAENNEIRDDLFESNIRHFQGSVDVNKKIKNSIEKIKNEDFWWLNNGITVIAEEPKEVGKKLSIENIQIVNGLQTSYSIFNNYIDHSDDSRSVLVKVIITKDKETIDNIIASTNSQNPVSATLLRATEQVQRDLELYFLNEGYYYDRRKNYYKNQGKPSTKIFSIQYVAQSIEAIINDDPHTARAKPTSLLKSEVTYKRIFDKTKNFQAYLNSCLVNKKVQNMISKYDNFDSKSKVSNFKLHMCCIVVKKLYSKKIVTFDEIVNINMEDIDEALFNESIIFLSDQIDLYLTQNTGTNLINIAKSKEFTNYLFDQILKV